MVGCLKLFYLSPECNYLGIKTVTNSHDLSSGCLQTILTLPLRYPFKTLEAVTFSTRLPTLEKSGRVSPTHSLHYACILFTKEIMEFLLKIHDFNMKKRSISENNKF